MAFIDDIVAGAQKAGKYVCEKAEDAKDYVSLEYKTASIKGKINEQYKQLGKLVYNKAEEQKINTVIQEIKKLNDELCAVSDDMAKFKNVCKNCKETNKPSAEFCCKCGNPLK